MDSEGAGFRPSPPPSQERVRGALLGLAVGDALGSTLEWSEPKAPSFPSLARGPHREIVGGGPFRLVPGQVTDDTHMACCLAASLRARGRLDRDDVAARYVAWQQHTFDVGSQTAAALNAIREGTPPSRAGREVWRRAQRKPAGNGSLMRAAPIAALLAGAEARRAAALADAAITHFDPRCRLAGAAFVAALGAAIDTGAAPAALRDAARAELAPAAAALAAEGVAPAELAAAARALAEDLALAAADDPRLYGRDVHLHRTPGFVRVAFRLAFWELLHAEDFEEALVDAVNRGGDADTNGAVAGALLGAAHGQAAIPARWRDAVLAAVPREEGPLREAYHPRALLGLAPGR